MDQLLYYLYDIRLILTIITIFIGLIYTFKGDKLKNYPPGPRSYPLIGNIWYMFKNERTLHQTCLELSKEIGPIIGLHWGSKRFVILNDLNSIKQAFVKQSDVFSGRPLLQGNIRDALSYEGQVRGVVVSEGLLWRKTRIFHYKMLNKLNIGSTSKSEQVILNEFELFREDFHQFGSEPFNAQSIINKTCLNIVHTYCFGSRINKSDQFDSLLTELEQFFKVRRNKLVNNLPILRFTPLGKSYYHMSNVLKRMDEIIRQQIEDHRDTFEPGEFRDLVDVYLDEEYNDTNEIKGIQLIDVQRTIEELFMAGVLTVSGSIQWAFVYLIHHPDVQVKCQAEIDDVVGREEYVLFSDKKNLPYTTATLNEIQRMTTISPFTIPHRVTRDTSLMGYNIPKDTMVVANLHAVHRDVNAWDNPETFTPSRWLEENNVVKKNENLVPFGVGARRCLGEILARSEYFLFVVNILQRYRLCADGNKLPSLEAPHQRVITPKPFEMIVEKR